MGGGGGNAINNMIANHDAADVEFIAVNTDAQALALSNGDVKLKIGEEVTRGLGSGGNPSTGKKAAEESVDLIHESLAGAGYSWYPADINGKATMELQIEGTFTEMNWDFVGESANGSEDIWVMSGCGYPVLSWQVI